MRAEQEYLLTSDDAMLSCLKTLIDYDEKFKDMGLYLYSWITTVSCKPELIHQRNTINKRLLMLYYQIKTIEN